MVSKDIAAREPTVETIRAAGEVIADKMERLALDKFDRRVSIHVPRTDGEQIVLALNARGFTVLPRASHDTLEARVLELEVELTHLRTLIVSYADGTHHTVMDPTGDWRDIAREWAGVVAAARATTGRETQGGGEK